VHGHRFELGDGLMGGEQQEAAGALRERQSSSLSQALNDRFLPRICVGTPFKRQTVGQQGTPTELRMTERRDQAGERLTPGAQRLGSRPQIAQRGWRYGGHGDPDR
jgi:hypothetical protein